MDLRLQTLLWIPILAFGGSTAEEIVPTRSASLQTPSTREAQTDATPTGVVEGRIQLEGSVERSPPLAGPYASRRYRPPPPSGSRSGSLEDVVVYVLVENPEPAPPGTSFQIVQRDHRIIPSVSAIQVGTRVDFPNLDDVYHNLFSLSGAHTFNLGRYPPGDTRSETFSRPGLVRMFCDIHSEMTAVIHVLETPYFTRPNETGDYRIEGVPEGRRTVVAAHASAPPDSVDVAVPASGVVRADFLLRRRE